MEFPTPEEKRKALEDIANEAIQALLTQIHNAIECADSTNRIMVNLRSYPNESARKGVQVHLRKFGWNVQFHSCQRDGASAEINPIEKSTSSNSSYWK